jgi:hypothetical protein
MDIAAEFVERGFVKVAQAFPEDVAAECLEILWKDTGCDPDDPATWTEPVVRLGGYAQEPFQRAADAEPLRAACDELVGAGRWVPREGLGGFPVRFPSEQEPGDDGWHVEGSFQGDAGETDYFHWRVNLASRNRALLMLFLFSEVGPDEAPTRLRVGSHRTVARLLSHRGEEGVPMLPLSARAAEDTADLPVELATGRPGDVYLCHPFLVHAAQAHHGTRPRFMAQPGLYPTGDLDVEHGTAPVEVAIREALAQPE